MPRAVLKHTLRNWSESGRRVHRDRAAPARPGDVGVPPGAAAARRFAAARPGLARRGEQLLAVQAGRRLVRLHVGAVAEAFVDVGRSAQWRIPPDLVERFGLAETDDDEFDRLWDAAHPAP